MGSRRQRPTGAFRRPGTDAHPTGQQWTGPTAALALQRLAGNRATTGLILRKPQTKEAEPPALDTQGEFALALDHIQSYYSGVRSLLELEDKVRENALKNFSEFSKLRDPPSIAGAIFAEVFTQIVGLIPGGQLVTAAVTAGVFARQMAKFEKDMKEYPIPGMSVEEEREKGPSDKTKAKVEKVYGHGKTGVEAGKAVIAAGLKAAEAKAAASAAEAAAQEAAAMGGKRIADWTKATELSYVQQTALRDKVVVAYRKGAEPGKLKEFVEKATGPRPRLTAELQDKLERESELALYREILTMATVKHRLYQGNSLESESVGTHLELVAGGKPSAALLRRIAELLRLPHLAAYPDTLGMMLNAKRSYRESVDKRPAYSGNRV